MYKMSVSDEVLKKWAQEEADYDISAGPEITSTLHPLNIGTGKVDLFSMMPLETEMRYKAINFILGFLYISVVPKFVVYSKNSVKVKWKFKFGRHRRN